MGWGFCIVLQIPYILLNSNLDLIFNIQEFIDIFKEKRLKPSILYDTFWAKIFLINTSLIITLFGFKPNNLGNIIILLTFCRCTQE